MNWRIPLLVRRALTMLPSLIILGLAVNTSQALVFSQIVLSFGIPFALIPLLLITRDRGTMADMTNRRLTSVLMLLTTVIITSLNIYLLADTITGALLSRARAKSERLRHGGIGRGLVQALVEGAVLGHQGAAAAPWCLLLGHQGAGRDEQAGD